MASMMTVTVRPIMAIIGLTVTVIIDAITHLFERCRRGAFAQALSLACPPTGAAPSVIGDRAGGLQREGFCEVIAFTKAFVNAITSQKPSR